jgi:hypothetical protein
MRANRIDVNKLAMRVLPQKMPGRRCKIADIKINYDGLTRSILEKIGVRNDARFFSGLINFRSGQITLMSSDSHRELSKLQKLLISKNNPISGWYGFRISYYDFYRKIITVSPGNAQFPRIPIRLSSVFERCMKEMLGDKAAMILFQQMSYDRGLSKGEQSYWQTFLPKINMLLVPESMSNDDLRKIVHKASKHPNSSILLK